MSHHSSRFFVWWALPLQLFVNYVDIETSELCEFSNNFIQLDQEI